MLSASEPLRQAKFIFIAPLIGPHSYSHYKHFVFVMAM